MTTSARFCKKVYGQKKKNQGFWKTHVKGQVVVGGGTKEKARHVKGASVEVGSTGECVCEKMCTRVINEHSNQNNLIVEKSV